MTKNILYILTIMLLLAKPVRAQVNYNFFDFKRAIINLVSANIDSISNLQVSEQDLILEFSDYKRYSYHFSNPKGPTGFGFFRDTISNNFMDSACIIHNSSNLKKIYFSFDNVHFEGFMAGLGNRYCIEKQTEHIFFKKIQDPIEGWLLLEDYFFHNISSGKYQTERAMHEIYINIPVSIFKDRKLLVFFLLRLKIGGVGNIKIDKVLSFTSSINTEEK
jgi:hypothetical protein